MLKPCLPISYLQWAHVSGWTYQQVAFDSTFRVRKGLRMAWSSMVVLPAAASSADGTGIPAARAITVTACAITVAITTCERNAAPVAAG